MNILLFLKLLAYNVLTVVAAVLTAGTILYAIIWSMTNIGFLTLPLIVFGLLTIVVTVLDYIKATK